MQRKQRLSFICLAVAAVSLITSFYLFNRLILALISLLPICAMFFARRPSLPWLAHFSLAGFTGLSAVGVLLDIPLMLMALASVSALASWDMVLEMHAESPTTELYDRLHLIYLGVTLGLGVLGIGIFHLFHWRFSFFGLLVLGIILLICLNQIMNFSPQNRESQR